jgi:hypothetical protein
VVRNRLAMHAVTIASATALAVGAAAGGAAAAAARGPVSPSAGSSKVVISSKMAAVTGAPAVARLGGVKALGAMAPASEVSGAVALNLRDQAGLASFIASASDPRSPMHGRYLSSAEFDAQYGPTPAGVGAVEAVLRSDGLSVTGVSGNGLLVSFSGAASQVERAFRTGIERYRLADGDIGYGTTSAVEIPASIAGEVTAVAGLDDLVRYRSQVVRAPAGRRAARVKRSALPAAIPGAPNACSDAVGQEQFGAITDSEVAYSYGVDGLYQAGDLGAGQTVDIFELEPFLLSDVQQFDECYFGTDHTSQVTTMPVDGGSGVGEGSGEAALDVEDVSAIAPAAHIHVYEGPDTSLGSLDVYNDMVVADDSRAISTSWGLCETALQAGAPGTQAVENSIFMEAAAQGESVFGPAGDDGSDDCTPGPGPTPQYLSVDDPSSQPYVVGVGGTTFLSTTEPPDETVWNDDGTGGGGGGGVSETWEMTSWQQYSAVPGVTNNPYTSYSTATAPPTYPYQACSNDPSGTGDDERPAGSPSTLPAGTLCREVPDVTALADEYTGITVYFAGYGGWTNFGGTSSSTPLWAAMTVDIDASNFCSGEPDGAGFVTPGLYAVAADPTSYAEAFNNITQGNNDTFDTGTDLPLGAQGNTYQAAAGYNLASGLGSPRITDADGSPGLAELLCESATSATRAGVTSVSPAYGTASGGTTVTITGHDFGADVGTVQFGDTSLPAADIESWTCSGADCTVVVAAPPFVQAPGTFGPPGGVVDVVVQPAVTSEEASAPNPAGVFHYLATPSGSSPAVEYVSPPAGSASGGTTVHVIGSGFEDGSVTSVTFGGQAGGSVQVLSDSELSVTTPSGTGATCSAGSSVAATGACQVQVVVTTSAGGASPTSDILPAAEGPVVTNPAEIFVPAPGCDCEVVPAATEFDYAPAPTVTSITPAYSSAYGGTTETIDGSGFNMLTYEWTNFGPSNAGDSQDLNLVSITPDSLQVVALGAALGVGTEPLPTGVSVQSYGGLGLPGPSSPFAYAGIPEVSGLSTTAGPTTGDQALTITGSGLIDASSVQIVSQSSAPLGTAVSVVYLSSPPTSDTSLTIYTPAGVPGPNDVEVCSATDCSAADPAVDSYTYAYPGQPIVTNSGPSSGPAHGGTSVTINGQLLSDLRAVYFGSRLAESWASGPSQDPEGSPTQVTAVAPPGVAGSTVDVTVLTSGSPLASPVSSRATFTYSDSAPSAPVAVRAAALGGGATVAWAAPLSDGGDAFTGYLVSASSPGRASAQASLPTSAGSYTFAALQPGVSWTFTVRATSALGTGLAGVSAPVVPVAGDNGYLVATANGAVLGFGSLASAGGTGGLTLPDPVAGIAATADGLGYVLVLTDGDVYAFGNAGYNGAPSLPAGSKVAGVAGTPDGHGYWIVTASGAVYGFGDAHYHGGTVATTSSVVGIASTPDGLGYYLAEADGDVVGFGDAVVRGNLLGHSLAAPIVGIAVNPSDGGYWLVGADGGVFAFANAGFHGSMIGEHLNEGAVGLASTPDGAGYWIVAADSGVFTFGSARYEGNPMGVAQSAAVAIAS